MVEEASSPLVDTARSFARRLPERSAEIERARTLPSDLVAQLADAGLFRTFVPASLGGAEASVADGLAVIEELAVGDGSAAWCVMIAMTTGLLAGFLSEEHAKEVYGPSDSITGGFAAPVGSRDGAPGRRVAGHWTVGLGLGNPALHMDWWGLPSGRRERSPETP